MRKQLYAFTTNSLSRVLKTPTYLILFVSDQCPNNCTHCWYTKEWKSKNLKSSTLSFDELEKISLSIQSLKFLSITGGEAFLRDDIEDIADLFIQNTKLNRFDIPTSGFDADMITQKTERILQRNSTTPFRVDVSLDGLEETHNKIRHNLDAFRNAIKTIESLSNLIGKYPNFDLSVISTISQDNYSEAEQLGKYVQKILPKGEWMVNMVRGSQPKHIVSQEVITAYGQINQLISKRKENHEFSGDRNKFGKFLTAKNSLRRNIIMEISHKQRKGGGCAAGSLAGVIFNDGDVRPCETLPYSFGNIRDFNYNLAEAWNNPHAREIRKQIQQTNCICTHECFLSVSILIQPSCWFGLIKERMKV